MTHIVLCQQYCDAHRGFNVLLYRIFLEKQHYVSNIFISSVTYHYISTRSTITNIMLCMKYEHRSHVICVVVHWPSNGFVYLMHTLQTHLH